MRPLYEAIQDSDEKLDLRARRLVANEWMKHAAKAYRNECKEGEDYDADENGNIQIYGICSEIRITDKDPILKKLNPYVKIISLDPMSSCSVKIEDADAAMNIMPLTQWGRGDQYPVLVEYNTKQNLLPKHFPMLIHGHVKIAAAGNIDFSIMPNCTGEFQIVTKKCGEIKWPAGFPSSAKLIKIGGR